MHALRHLKTLLPTRINTRAIRLYITLYGYILYQSGKMLMANIVCTRSKLMEVSEKVWLRGTQKVIQFMEKILRVGVHYTTPSSPLPPQMIIVSNHQSYFDILLIRGFLSQHNIRFIASGSMKYGFPGISRIMRIQEHAFIKQLANPLSALRTIRDFARQLSGTHLSPVIFPEGKLARDGMLQPFFSAGIRQLLAHLDIPIVMVLIRNSYYLNSLESISSPVSIHVEVLQCIETAERKKYFVQQINHMEQIYRTALIAHR